jgi:hypothetical protein
VSTNAYTSGVPGFSAGQPVSARALELLREANQRGLPQRATGAFVKQFPGGSLVSPWSKGRRVGLHPFKVLDAGGDGSLQVSIVYGAVIDLTDWQKPVIRDPKINGEELHPDEEGKRPKLALPQSAELFVCVVIKQGENGAIEEDNNAVTIEAFDQVPESQDGTLYVHLAKIKTKSAGSERRIERIEQILGSHIVWPWKPDFMGWQQKNGDTKSAWWLGAESDYAKECDPLEELYLNVQREEFDNGRDGNSVFKLKMTEGGNYELTFDFNQKQGLELLMTENATHLTLARKSTSWPGATLTVNDEYSSLVVNKDDAISAELKASDEAKLELESPHPVSRLLGDAGRTIVSTINDEEIIMRKLSFLIPPAKSPQVKEAYFLMSEPKSPDGEPPDSNMAEHHAGHDSDPDPGEDSNHTNNHANHDPNAVGGHHSSHAPENHESDDEPTPPSGGGGGGHHSDHDNHHSNHHNDDPTPPDDSNSAQHHAGHESDADPVPDPGQDSNHTQQHASHNPNAVGGHHSSHAPENHDSNDDPAPPNGGGGGSGDSNAANHHAGHDSDDDPPPPPPAPPAPPKFPFPTGPNTGRCSVCGRPISTPESVARGMGPVCAAKQ